MTEIAEDLIIGGVDSSSYENPYDSLDFRLCIDSFYKTLVGTQKSIFYWYMMTGCPTYVGHKVSISKSSVYREIDKLVADFRVFYQGEPH